MFFVAMRYGAAAFFPLFLHGKERGMREQKREKTWFKDLLEDFCNGNPKKDFGMSGESFRELVALLAPRISKNDTSFRKAIPVQKRVAAGLWRPATGNSYGCVAKTFAIGKSATVKISEDFCSALRLQSCTYIKFPDSTVATKHAIETFKADNNCRRPQSLGAIDCTHIFIKVPDCESKYDYYCRKQRYSVKIIKQLLMLSCFLRVATGFLGSMHDTRVLRQTNLFERVESGKILHAAVKKIRNVEVRPQILGDGGYLLHSCLVKPFNFTTTLSRKEKQFNRVLSSSRVSVEKDFGLLKA